MRKREILRHYKSSLKKWEWILFAIMLKINIDTYKKTFWRCTTCGFCIVHDCFNMSKPNGRCPLDGYLCVNAHDSLLLADRKDWPEAEKLCKQFIAKIKREIARIKREIKKVEA